MHTEGFCFTAMHLLQSYGCFVKIKTYLLLYITYKNFGYGFKLSYYGFK